jgi:hypothetical protein
MADRLLHDDELALIYRPNEGLTLELPTDGLPIGIDGAVLTGVFIRLQRDEEWADELKQWVMAEMPAMLVM